MNKRAFFCECSRGNAVDQLGGMGYISVGFERGDPHQGGVGDCVLADFHGSTSRMNDFLTAYEQHSLTLDQRPYQLAIRRNVSLPVSAPRLLIVSYLPTHLAWLLLKVCLKSLRRYTPQPVEIWVIDNNSPLPQAERLANLDDVNVVWNLTEPHPPQKQTWFSRWFGNFGKTPSQQQFGSYANAVGLEIGTRLIDPKSQQVMTLHMDTLACHENWLPELQRRLTDQTAAAGVRLDRMRTPEGVLHVLGMLVDFQRFQSLKLNFFPELPRCDVGDLVTLNLREAGFSVAALHNTFSQPELINRIPNHSPFSKLHVDRTFDDEGNVIFLHLGRGVKQSLGVVRKKTAPEQWVAFAETLLRKKQRGPTYAA